MKLAKAFLAFWVIFTFWPILKVKPIDTKAFEQNDEKTTEVSEQNPTLIDTPAVVDRDEKEVDSEPAAEAPIEIDEPVIENKIKTEIPIIREDLVNDKPLLETKEIAEPEIKTEIPIILEDLVNDEPLGRAYGMPEIDEDDLEAEFDTFGDDIDEEYLVLYDRLINLPSNGKAKIGEHEIDLKKATPKSDPKSTGITDLTSTLLTWS